MDDKSVIDLKTFVPAKDPLISRQFYSDLGFKQNWANDQIAEFQIGAFRFLLQNFYVKEYASNFMMSLLVEDADLWWKQITDINLTEKYPGIMARPPAKQPWGLRVLYLSDPSGVLWHIADQRNAQQLHGPARNSHASHCSGAQRPVRRSVGQLLPACGNTLRL